MDLIAFMAKTNVVTSHGVASCSRAGRYTCVLVQHGQCTQHFSYAAGQAKLAFTVVFCNVLVEPCHLLIMHHWSD